MNSIVVSKLLSYFYLGGLRSDWNLSALKSGVVATRGIELGCQYDGVRRSLAFTNSF